MSDAIGKAEMNTQAVSNAEVQSAKKGDKDSAAKKLLMAGLSIFAPGAACLINAGEAIRDSGVLESQEFKSLVETGEKITRTTAATMLLGPLGTALALAEESKKEESDEQTGKNLNSEA